MKENKVIEEELRRREGRIHYLPHGGSFKKIETLASMRMKP
jgi:hypothetical protein